MEKIRRYLHVTAEIVSAIMMSIAISLGCATISAYFTASLYGAALGAAAGITFAISCFGYTKWRAYVIQTANGRPPAAQIREN